jgi:hypothetical protein
MQSARLPINKIFGKTASKAQTWALIQKQTLSNHTTFVAFIAVPRKPTQARTIFISRTFKMPQ